MIADRRNPRRVVALAVGSWSVFTALTGAAEGYLSLVFVRFAFGGMEAALAPAITSSFARWVPNSWRTTAFGLFLGGGRLGGAFAPSIAAILLLRYGWRSTFILVALAGLLVAIVWLRAVPSILPNRIGSIGVEQASATSWSFRLIALLLVAFTYTVMWQFFATWYPTYLVERRGFSLSEAALYASIPFLFGIGSNTIGGFLCDALCRRIGLALGRALLGCSALLAAAVLFYLGIISSAKAAPWLLAAAAGAGDLLLPMSWSVATDLGGKSAGTIAGLSNSASNLGGFVSPIILGAAVEHWKNWDSSLMICVCVTVLSALLWVPVNWPERKEVNRIV
jgi:MFS transporter, ACS family, glucarate transporter